MMSSQSQPVLAEDRQSEAQPSAAFTPPPHVALYFGDWKPKGIRADWDKCSMEKASTAQLLGDWGRKSGEMIEAVAWFDFDGGLRVLVADYAGGRRLICRFNTRGGWKLAFERHQRASLAEGEAKAATPAGQGPGTDQ